MWYYYLLWISGPRIEDEERINDASKVVLSSPLELECSPFMELFCRRRAIWCNP